MPTSGSSPLTRGKQVLRHLAAELRRLIPAHAGKTDEGVGTHQGLWAHPRSRGENARGCWSRARLYGSSPLTRGKQQDDCDCCVDLGLIPAHAGKTKQQPTPALTTQAHPRSRGENHPLLQEQDGVRGSSPLTRGKQPPGEAVEGRPRLIPAHAGKTLPDLRFYCADRSDLGKP